MSSSAQRKQPSTLAAQPAALMDVDAEELLLALVLELLDVDVEVEELVELEDDELLDVDVEVEELVELEDDELLDVDVEVEELVDVEVLEEEDELSMPGMVAVPFTHTRPSTPVPLSSVPLGQAPTQSPLCR